MLCKSHRPIFGRWPWLLLLALLAGCAGNSREVRVTNVFGTPLAGAQVNSAPSSAQPQSTVVAQANIAGEFYLPRSGGGASYYVITMPGYRDFWLSSSMLGGYPPSGKGFRLEDDVLVLTLDPLQPLLAP
jgi:hypothetical protein